MPLLLKQQPRAMSPLLLSVSGSEASKGEASTAELQNCVP